MHMSCRMLTRISLLSPLTPYQSPLALAPTAQVHPEPGPEALDVPDNSHPRPHPYSIQAQAWWSRRAWRGFS